MKHTLSICFFVSLFALVPAAFGFQDEGAGQGPTEESIAALQEAIDNLTTAVKEKSESDQVLFSKEVAKKWAGGDKKQQSAAIKLLGKLAKSKDRDVSTTAIESLSKTGGDAYKLLVKEMNGGKAKKDLTYFCLCIKSVGKLAEPKAVKPLTKLLNHKDNTVIAQAVSALGDYREAPTKLRKQIVDSLLKVYSSVASAGTRTNPRTADKAKYDALYGPFESALKALTKQAHDGANTWANWYRKEGKKAKEW